MKIYTKGVISLNIQRNGIDISYANKKLNFEKIKEGGVSFAIIRTGYRQKTDDMFESHMKNAIAAGLDVGVYCYCMAKTNSEAKEEAEYVINLIKPYKLTYPVFYDIEEPKVLSLSKTKLTNVALSFLDTIDKANYRAGLYANPSILENNLNKDKILDKYDLWLANWTNDPDIPSGYKFGQKMWQWGAERIYGSDERVDCNICYVDYPAIIAANGQWGEEKEKFELSIGDMVLFSGGWHYPGANSETAVGNRRTAGTAQITNIVEGARHPIHLIGDSSNVYGWVDENAVFPYSRGRTAQAGKAVRLLSSPKSDNALIVIPSGGRFIVFKEYKDGKNGIVIKAAYDGNVGYVEAGDFFLIEK